ncbi:MAG: hypothetical protein ACSHYB_08345 [Roseibacillus sp.]
MKLSEERLAEFNSRMNDWISKQGLIFQLTHGGTGLGGKPPIIGSIVRFTISVLLLSLLSLICYGGFLLWKVTGDDLPKQLEKSLSKTLGAEELTAVGFERDLASGNYKQIMVIGGDNTFYNHLEARGIQLPMEPASGLFGAWDAKSINIVELKIALKAGEASDERAQNSWNSLFFDSPNFTFSKLVVTKTNLTWGYSSPATWGAIKDSSLTALRSSEGWELKFRGGTFSQGIFRDFEIESMSVELKKDGGLKITDATLTIDEGTFQWSGEMVTGGARPIFQVNGHFTAIPLSAFLPRGLLSFVNGTISGKASASGSTNDSDGICYQISGQPHGKEGIILTKELVLLRMLSHLDPQRSYRKVLFNEGSFELNTQGNTLSFSKVELSSQDAETAQTVARLRGSFEARPTTKEELEEKTYSLDEDSQNTSETIGAPTSSQMSLEDQAIYATSILRKYQTLQFANPPQELYYFTKDSKGDELLKKRLDLTPRRIFRFPYVVEGGLELAVPTTAFKEAPPLPSVSPHEDNTDLQWIKINLRDLVQETTKRLSGQWEQTLNEAAEDE